MHFWETGISRSLGTERRLAPSRFLGYIHLKTADELLQILLGPPSSCSYSSMHTVLSLPIILYCTYPPCLLFSLIPGGQKLLIILVGDPRVKCSIYYIERLYKILVKFYIHIVWVLILALPFLSALNLDNKFIWTSVSLFAKWDW